MYQKPTLSLWTGRTSENRAYLHEKVRLVDLLNLEKSEVVSSFALLGYAGDEGVRRNKGRIGAVNGPEAVRNALTKQANHLPRSCSFIDVGNIIGLDHDLEGAHEFLSSAVTKLLDQQHFPMLIGGGHDLSFAHYQGIRKFLNKGEKIGIINLDAHFDLREKEERGNSGTPFYQIATELEEDFHYLCLGIQRQANTPELFKTAKKFEVDYLFNHEFTVANWQAVSETLTRFMTKVDHIYLTVDLDGFSSSIAPGVSAASPLGFSWDIAYKTIQSICNSEKLISMDIVELNPTYDVDLSTAKLAAGIVHHVMDWLSD